MDTDALIATTHPSWHGLLAEAVAELDTDFVNKVALGTDAIPFLHQRFAAFCLDRQQVQLIVLGESPYPRFESANGRAFHDAAVGDIWSDTGLSKAVNRATSLRNILKAWLLASGRLPAADLTQIAIKAMDKTGLVTTLDELFDNAEQAGWLFLNAALTLTPGMPKKRESQGWRPFIATILKALDQQGARCLLMGKHAEPFAELVTNPICVEHPYNLSFITNPATQDVLGRWQTLLMQRS